MIKAYAAPDAKSSLEPFEYEPGDLADDEVDIEVAYCGICHSDLSMMNNDWGISSYPLVPGHEIAGTVAAVGDSVTHLKPGDSVGVGWYSRSCNTCEFCLSGQQNLCPQADATIVGRHGGFASHVRAQALWATPIPSTLDPAKVGPLFCGGITVFGPIVRLNISPTDRVAVVGIGGLGHMALQFLKAWGCEVTAFSSSPDKEPEARALGAHHFISSRDEAALDAARSRFDVVLVTVNVELDWERYVNTLRPGGRLHIVGAAPKFSSPVSPLLEGEKAISASPLGSPATTLAMVDFTARHSLEPKTESFPMSQANEALAKLRKDKPAHRLVLEADF